MTRAKDPELKAMGVCIDALLGLQGNDELVKEARERVLGYLNERFMPGVFPLGTTSGSFSVEVDVDDPLPPPPAPPTDGVVG